MHSSVYTEQGSQQTGLTNDSDVNKMNKMTTILTNNHTEGPTTIENNRVSDLSNIILNLEDFWLKKVPQIDGDNEECNSVERKSQANGNSIQKDGSLPAESLVFEEGASLKMESNPGSLEYIDDGTLQAPPQLQARKISDSYEQKKNKEFHELQRTSNQNLESAKCSMINSLILESQNSGCFKYIHKKMKDLEEMSLLGYWCNFYLKETAVNWQITCILLYKEVILQMKTLMHKSPRIRSQNMLVNLQNMVNRIQACQFTVQYKQLLDPSHGDTLFPSILKQSEKLVKELMKFDVNSKVHQFCLFKTLRAVNLAAKHSGFFENEEIELEDQAEKEQFSVSNLRTEMIFYKKQALVYRKVCL